MEQQRQITASHMVEALTSWWNLAGLDAVVSDQTVNWLAIDALEKSVEKQDFSKIETAAPAISIATKSLIAWPGDIDRLKDMIANGADLPGNKFGTASLPAVGPAKSDIVIVSDLPDADDLASGALDGGASGALLNKMLAAIEIDLSACYWTALATTRPSTGEIPDESLPQLTEFIRHQIALVKPNAIILLGSSACNALLGEELLKSRRILGKINHDGISMPVMTTFHPRTLIARPSLKAQAWRDLQMFAKRSEL
ncbi:hypothetical protein EUU23_04620 [Sphingorhabdus sp. IMCC26285]|uniref:Uracil-DNA glycosylase-like domain-containing protein n=1 Tax=Sphingorhabdus profundilacus TaxID=2509718 RepID=A0A6I4M3D6_9SPHN|nr:uracil-DNA glycosylase [Sphingorhabdus profundilacus]MVZ96988.1 hypothetical protein [Sphingorhabdus profundilacus]